MKKRLILTFFLFGVLSLSSCGTFKQGEQGEQGLKGDQGQEGPKGDKGEAGSDGKDGATVLTGEGTPLDTLGKKDDIYINTKTGNLYAKNELGWKIVGNLKGAQGDKGETPEITVGANGNWFIDGVDSTIPSHKDKDITNDPNTSDGFTFKYGYEKGQYGLIIDEYYGEDENVIMPNTINDVPVISFTRNAFTKAAPYISSIKFSKNLIKLNALSGQFSVLETIDFNNCKAKEVPFDFIANAQELSNVILSESTKVIGERAFTLCGITNIDFKNVETIERYAFDHCVDSKHNEHCSFYVPKTVKSVNDSFGGAKSIYFEANKEDEGYDYKLNNLNADSEVIYGIKKNDNFLYEIVNNEYVIIHKDLKKENDLIIPSEIDNLPVKGSGKFSFSEEREYANPANRELWAYDYLEFPSSFERIGLHAFENLSAACVYIPNTNLFTLNDEFQMHTFSRMSTLITRTPRPVSKVYKNTIILLDNDEFVITPNKELLVRFLSEGENSGYHFYGFLKTANNLTTITSNYKNIPVQFIDSKAILDGETKAFSIPKTVQHISENALFVREDIYIPDNVIIESKGITTESYYILNQDSKTKWLDGAIVSTSASPANEITYIAGLEVTDNFLVLDMTDEDYSAHWFNIVKYDMPVTKEKIIDIKFPRSVFNLNEGRIFEIFDVLTDEKIYNVYLPSSYTFVSSTWIRYANGATVNIFVQLPEKEANIVYNSEWLTRSDAKFNVKYNQDLGY